MRREIFLHFAFWISFFVLISIIKGFLNLNYWPFWVGGLIGLFLPDLDHLIYVMFLSPQELTSQRLGFLVNRKEIGRAISLLYETRNERKGLIFHTIFFQIIFLILTFWIATSSSSIFGKGLALSFALHLGIDQLMDLVEIKSLNNWTKFTSLELDYRKSVLFLSASFLAILIIGFLM